MNSDIENAVISTIIKQCKEQDSSAYFEVLCDEVFGEMNERNEKKLTSILDNLRAKGIININGDRITVIKTNDDKKKCDFLFVNEDLSNMINDSGLKVTYEYTDIGHGTNVLALCGYIQDNWQSLLILLIMVGCKIKDLKDAFDGYNFIFNKLKEIKENFINEHDEDPMLYLGDDLLLARVISEILTRYEISFDDIQCLNLTQKVKTKVGASGYYSIHKHNCSEESLQGSPEAIYYFVLELYSEKIPSDYDVIRCEILTNGEIKYFSTLHATLEYNF